MNYYFNFDKLLVIMLTQRRLQHLLVLAQYAHFGRAAQSLHISQPALTKSIQSLEAELGVTLLDRQRGAVALTAFGELVVKRSKSWLRQKTICVEKSTCWRVIISDRCVSPSARTPA